MGYSTRKPYATSGVDALSFYKAVSYTSAEQTEKRGFTKPYEGKGMIERAQKLALPEWKLPSGVKIPGAFNVSGKSRGVFDTEEQGGLLRGYMQLSAPSFPTERAIVVQSSVFFPGYRRPEVVDWDAELAAADYASVGDVEIKSRYTPLSTANVNLRIENDWSGFQDVEVTVKAKPEGVIDPWEKVPFIGEKEVKDKMLVVSESAIFEITGTLPFEKTEAGAERHMYFSGNVGKCRTLGTRSGVWATAHDATAAVTARSRPFLESGAKNSSATYRVRRTFLSFPVGYFPSGGSCTIAKILIKRQTGDAGVRLMVQEGTQSDPIDIYTEFAAFEDAAFVDAVVAWGDYVDGQAVTITLNAAARTYIDGVLAAEANPIVKFCIREYDHDHQDAAPDPNTSHFSAYYNQIGLPPMTHPILELTVDYA